MHGLKNLNPLNAKLNPICHLLALLGAHRILHVSGIRVKPGGDSVESKHVAFLCNKLLCLTETYTLYEFTFHMSQVLCVSALCDTYGVRPVIFFHPYR
jgi:hypothetical protein